MSNDTPLYADLTLLYLGRVKEFDPSQPRDDSGKWSDSGGGSSGGSGGSSGGGDKTKAPPPPKISKGYKLHDQFTNRKGTITYAVQSPENGSDKGWIITFHSRVNNRAYSSFGKPIHSLEQRDTKENILNDFSSLKRQIG